MDQDVMDRYREAGRIAAEARDRALELAEPGVPARELVDAVEGFIRDEGAQPAFPVNVSIDADAAHWTPGPTEDCTLKEGQVVNLDVGVHVDGYIGDTAATVDLSGDHAELVQASADALDAALDLVEPGVKLGAIGAAIEDMIEGAGFKPVRNLSGHGLDRYTQHTGDSIPNIATDTEARLEEGAAVAIEPFASTGAGRVVEGGRGNIYRVDNTRARGRMQRKLLKEAERRFKTLPFAARWIESVPVARLDMVVAKLTQAGTLHGYDVLKDEAGGMVSQKEHTVLVLDEPVVTTRL